MPLRIGALGLLAALLAVPLAGADALADPDGDADGGLDVIEVAWTVGNATVAVEVRFEPGDLPDDRAVRGVLLLGTPGAAEPAEWYQFTIANETHAFAAHAGPKDAAIVGTSWTGDVARVELQREAPVADAATAPCAFAVVESGTMDAHGFVRSDVGPSGFASPEEAWPVDECPEAHASGALDEDGEDGEKRSRGLSILALLGVVALAALRRRA